MSYNVNWKIIGPDNKVLEDEKGRNCFYDITMGSLPK